MSLNLTALLNVVESHASASGQFEAVNGHEPDNPASNGLRASVWVQSLRPVQSSGLALTSGCVTLMVRCEANAQQEPQDSVDPTLMAAVDALMTSFSGDFSLGGLARCVDLLGQTGTALSMQAGWLPYADGSKSRVMDITVPIIVNDLWAQAE